MAEIAPAESTPNDTQLFEDCVNTATGFAFEVGKPRVVLHGEDRLKFDIPQEGQTYDAMVMNGEVHDMKTGEQRIMDVIAYTGDASVRNDRLAEVRWQDETAFLGGIAELTDPREEHFIVLKPDYRAMYERDIMDHDGRPVRVEERQLSDEELDKLGHELMTMRPLNILKR